MTRIVLLPGDGIGPEVTEQARLCLAYLSERRELNLAFETHDFGGAAIDRHGGLDVLVNNVGAVRTRLDGFLALADEDWAWAFNLNFLAAMRTMRAALPHLVQRPGAIIVTVSSVNAFLPDPGVVDYSAAKAALSNLCKSLSKELGPDVRVNTVSPGPVRTDLRWGAAALGTILLAFAIWNATRSRWCDPHSLLQGHAAWHLLDAVSAYLLFRLWASERAQ